MATEPQSKSGNRAAWFFRLGRLLLRAAIVIAQFVLVLWATLAVYYSNLPWPWARLVLAAAFAAFSVWALWLTRRPRMWLAFAGLFVAVAAWEASIPASHDRPWRQEVAVMPRAVVDGDRVRITGVRDFSYRDTLDFTPRYIDREVLLSHLTSVDFFLSYWGGDSGPVAHTFLSFNFDNAEPLAISIEARPEQGKGYDPLASMFKQFELIYVVGEERDIVGLRTTHRGEAVYLYPIQAPQAGVQRLFLIYMQRINELADHAEWYSLLKSSCTLNIVRYARAAGWAANFDPRQYLNGWADRYLYEEGLLSTALPFDKLRALSRIRETVRPGEGAPAFSRRIRSALQSIRSGPPRDDSRR
jgi:hypothetical protein